MEPEPCTHRKDAIFMIYYYGSNVSFLEFANKISIKDEDASIIIVDPDLYNSHFAVEPSASTLKNLLHLDHVNVILVENLSELIDLLEKTIKGSPTPLRTSSAIGIYDFFSTFLGSATSTTMSFFMDQKDYSAKTLNRICNLLYNISYYLGIKIYISDTGNELLNCGETANLERYPLIWNLTITSRDSTTFSGDSGNESKNAIEIPLKLILSKWVQEIIY